MLDDKLRTEILSEEDKQKTMEIASYIGLVSLLPLAIELPNWFRDSFKWPYWLFYIIAAILVVIIGVVLIRWIQSWFFWAIALTIMVMGIMWFLDIPLTAFVGYINKNESPEMFRKLYATTVSGSSAGIRFLCDKLLKGITARLVGKGKIQR